MRKMGLLDKICENRILFTHNFPYFSVPVGSFFAADLESVNRWQQKHIFIELSKVKIPIFFQNTGCHYAPPKTSMTRIDLQMESSSTPLSYNDYDVTWWRTLQWTRCHDFRQSIVYPFDLALGPTFCSYIVGASSPSWNLTPGFDWL